MLNFSYFKEILHEKSPNKQTNKQTKKTKQNKTNKQTKQNKTRQTNKIRHLRKFQLMKNLKVSLSRTFAFTEQPNHLFKFNLRKIVHLKYDLFYQIFLLKIY